MNFVNLIYTIPNYIRRTYRKIEKISLKIIRNRWSTSFNETCINENILPKYTKFRLHDPAITQTPTTLKYRKYLIEKEIRKSKEALKFLSTELLKHKLELDKHQLTENIKNNINRALDEQLEHSEKIIKTRITKKLSNLYDGEIYIKEDTPGYINLSNFSLTAEQQEFLNLGLNCHVQGKYSKIEKKTNIETLYQSLLNLEKENKITINPNIADQLRSEGTKHRNKIGKSIISPSLSKAACELKHNENIVIKRADKSALYVIMDKDEYINKLNQITNDTTKFQELKKDPTNNLKTRINKIITTLNATKNDANINKIIGDYSPGYLYGTVKTHKPGNTLRPIISQVTTPTYQLAKKLNNIIQKYIPSTYMLSSTNQLIDIVQLKECYGQIASLDVENLFTNVPIDHTIEIITNYCYNNQNIPPPDIPKKILIELLELCTKEAPFKSPNGKLYKQVDGVAMGSPLGPTFANYYMAHIENLILKDQPIKPNIYARYIDDIFVEVQNENELIKLKEIFENNSVLKFTYEKSIKNKLPFLDVLLHINNEKINTTIYRKVTDTGKCLNYKSECHQKYKNSVITNYLNRAYKICINWKDFHLEVDKIKQILVNNNYPNKIIDNHIKNFLSKKMSGINNTTNNIKIFYQNQMNDNYKIDERILQDILQNNIKCNNNNEKIKIIFYYKNIKTSNLVIKNNLSSTRKLDMTNIVYKFVCPFMTCKSEYIGHTRTCLKRRLDYHTYSGSIQAHYKKHQNEKISKQVLYDNTTIIQKESSHQKLVIKETLEIIDKKPTLNVQEDHFYSILKLYKNSYNNIRNNNIRQNTNINSADNEIQQQAKSTSSLNSAHFTPRTS